MQIIKQYGTWCCVRRRGLFRGYEFRDLDDVSSNVWWSMRDNPRDSWIYRDTKEEVEVALGWREAPPEPEPVLSEPTQSILKAVENRPQDFKLFERSYITHSAYDPLKMCVAIDRKTRLIFTRFEHAMLHRYSRYYHYKNNKGIAFTNDEYKAIEKALEALAEKRKKQREEAKAFEETCARHALTLAYKKYD